jgi:hypothetical protein
MIVSVLVASKSIPASPRNSPAAALSRLLILSRASQPPGAYIFLYKKEGYSPAPYDILEIPKRQKV